MLAFPLAEAFVANRAKEHTRGRYMGLFAMTAAAAAVVAPVAGTWVYEHHGLEVLWYSIALLGVLLWIGFHALGSRGLGEPPVSAEPT